MNLTLSSATLSGPLADGSTVRRRRMRARTSMAALAVVFALLLSAPPARAVDLTLSQEATDATGRILDSLKTQSSGSDPRYFSDAVWHDGSPDCFRCTLGPAVLSAVYASNFGLVDSQPKTDAITSLDRAIKDHQRSDGSFGPAAAGEGGPGIQTVEFANLLASTYLYLGLGLDLAHRRSWADSLTRSADYLVKSGNSRYYTNGNINLAITVNLDLTYRITKLARFKTAADASYSFTVAPPQAQWKGFGLTVTRPPTNADGSDGSGYLAEKGANGTGYDPAYGLFQTDIASMWYVVTGDARAKYLSNLLVNQLQPRVRTSDWTIDVSGGTRRSAPGLRYRFAVSAVAVLALKGGREDLKPWVRPMTLAALKDYQSTTSYSNPGDSYNYGIQLAPTVRAITTSLIVI